MGEMVKTGSENGKFWELDLKGLIRAKKKTRKIFPLFPILTFYFQRHYISLYWKPQFLLLSLFLPFSYNNS